MDANPRIRTIGLGMLLLAALTSPRTRAQDRVQIDSGVIEGVPGVNPGIRAFK